MSNSHNLTPFTINGREFLLPQAYGGAIEALNKWLHIVDWEAIDIILGSAAAKYVPGDPLWLRIIGPPGGTKTEILRAISGHPDSFELGNLTSGSLSGGFKGGYNLLKNISGKRVITPDLSPIITKNNETRKQLFGILRSVYDGKFTSAYGSEAGLVSQESNFDWLTAATPAIERHRTLDAELGERFLDIRPNIDREGAVLKAFENTLDVDNMRKELKSAITTLLDTAKYTSSLPQIHPDIAQKIPHLANLMTLFRSAVSRDRYHNITYIPQPELGTRAVHSLVRLAKGLALVRQKQVADEYVYKSLIRVAVDCIPSTRKLILTEYLRGNTDIKGLSKATNFSTGQVDELLKELELLGITKGKVFVDTSKSTLTFGNPSLWPIKIGYAEALTRG